MPSYADIAVEAPVPAVYTYRIPPALADRVAPGAGVVVPFHGRLLTGIVIELKETAGAAEGKTKDIDSVRPDEERLPPELLALTRWLSSYYRAPWGEALASCVPPAVRRGERGRTELHVAPVLPPEEARKSADSIEKRAPKQALALRSLTLLAAGGSVPLSELAENCGATAEQVRALAGRGWVAVTEAPRRTPVAELDETEHAVVLNPEQEQAVTAVCAALDRREFAPFLLHGVTGSGKTEVYLRCLAHALALGRSVLVLVPEISLTPQTVGRFRRRAGPIEVLHSMRGSTERAEAWRRILRGEARVVVGARSAVFAPLPDLGLLIVDEEHERSFKQDESPRYHARDVAVVRARGCGATILLGSATPSLETFHNARNGRYGLLSLPTRAGGARPPEVEMVDLRREWEDVKRPVAVSRRLERELRLRLERGEQSILFLNRRGFHTSVRCQACGETAHCPSCAISLTHHRRAGELRCHYCGHAVAAPEACAACGSKALRYEGTGTERIEHVLEALLPGARLLRMDSDTMTGKDAHAEALGAFARGDYDILLGTQMVALGFDFSRVTLVGVLQADAALDLPDFRAAERTFQLVTQVIGRAGRGDRAGRAVIQAFRPDHYALTCALRQDFAGFAERELAGRQALGYPPFGRLARLVARAKDGAKAGATLAAAAEAARAVAPRRDMVLGPATCPIERIQDEVRLHVLLKGKDPAEISRLLAAVAPALPRSGPVRVAVDVDPVSLL